jgi:hypothetical protein
LGLGVDEIVEFYMRMAPEVFGQNAGDGVFFQSKFESGKLRQALRTLLGVKTLGSEDLKTGLAIHTKRIDTGAAWVLTNHPLGAYYDPPASADGDILASLSPAIVVPPLKPARPIAAVFPPVGPPLATDSARDTSGLLGGPKR